MYCISVTSSSPPGPSLGQRKVEEVHMSVTNLWNNPSLEKRTWSLSEQSTAWLPAVFQTSTECGALPMVCYCQTRACLLLRLCESQEQRRSLWSLEDRERSFHFLRGHGRIRFPVYLDAQAGFKDVRGELQATPQDASAGVVCLGCSPLFVVPQLFHRKQLTA